MIPFRFLLAGMFAVLLSYTSIVIAHQGWGLLDVFFGDMARMAWPGQFNLDFMFMLTLSALWVGWRHRFSTPGLALMLLAFFGGASFLSVYLLVTSLRATKGVTEILIGPSRVETTI